MTAKNGNISVILKIVLVLAVLAVVGFFALQRFGDAAIVDEVTRGEALSAVPGSVVVYADKGIRELKTDLGGRVESSKALNPGDSFKKGELLMQLDTSDLRREMAEIDRTFKSSQDKRTIALKDKTAKTLADDALRNAQRLFARDDISKETVNAAQRAVEAVAHAEELEQFDNDKIIADHTAALDLKNALLKKMTLLAPEDGVVVDVIVWDGALINPGSTVATFTSASRIVKAKISEENIGAVRLGQEATVRLLVYPNEKFKAKVSKILDTADESQRFEIYLDVDIKPERLKHNQTGQVNVTVDRHPNQVLVPRRAMFNGNNVFVVKDGKVELRKIESGFTSLVRVEVLKGLQPGELVIVENIDQYRDGQRVRVQKTK